MDSLNALDLVFVLARLFLGLFHTAALFICLPHLIYVLHTVINTQTGLCIQ